jgi:hypothetical protein
MLFSRRTKDPRSAIKDFWVWWPTVRPQIESAIESGDWPDALVSQVGTRVDAIDAGLAWEFGAGSLAKHVLVVTSAGNRSLRATAERWRRAGPPADETFEFATTRRPDLGAFEAKLSLDGHMLALADLRYGYQIDDDRSEINVTVWHPAFRSLPDDARLQVAFLTLDWLLGEDGVELWVGRIDTSGEPDPPDGAVPPADIALAVADLADRHRKPVWALLRGTDRGRPVVAMIQVPLKPARWPHLDTHLEVRVPYRLCNDGGLPVESSLDALRELEDRINEYLDGAEIVAHESSAGVRTFHLYADGDVPAQALKPLISSWAEGRASVTATPDPRWDRVRHLRP